LAALLACVALSGCTAALYGHEVTGAGGAASATASSVRWSATGSNYAVGASFGRVIPPSAAGGQVVVSSGTASAVLLLGVVLINALDHFGGGSERAALKASANRPIAHTCSCYGYRPEEDVPAANE
jgi:hypothetical protein